MGHLRDVTADEKARTTGKLATEKERKAFVEKVATTMEEASRALLETAARLRADPERMLAQAYEPNITGMHPKAVAKLEITAYTTAEVVSPLMRITATTIINGSRFDEVAFSAQWSPDHIKPVSDNRLGA